MSNNFTVEIISPDKLVLRTETLEVTIPAYEGQMGILKDHIPLITFLRPGLINVKNNNKENFFYVEEGIVEFSNNNLLILSSSINDIKDLEKSHIDTIIKNSTDKMNSSEVNDKEKYILSYKIDTLKEISK